MKITLIYLLLGAITYSVICTLGWSWVLGLEFDVWKLPIIGVLNFFLNMVGNFILAKMDPKKKEG